MAIINRDLIGNALELLKQGLGPFVEREFQAARESKALNEHDLRVFNEDQMLAEKPIDQWDAAGLLKLMWDTWNDAFRKKLGPEERSFVGELRGYRNKWAHQENFTSDDAYRMLDSVERLLTAVSASEVARVKEMKNRVLRVMCNELSPGKSGKDDKSPYNVPVDLEPTESTANKAVPKGDKHKIQEILKCLGENKIRCTYEALFEYLGIPLNQTAIVQLLGERRPEASWIVNKRTRKPTGYKPQERAPDLFTNDTVIFTEMELRGLLDNYASDQN